MEENVDTTPEVNKVEEVTPEEPVEIKEEVVEEKPVEKERPAGVTILGALYILQGVLWILGPFIVFAIIGSMLAEVDAFFFDPFAIGGIVLICFMIFLIIGIINIFIGVGLLKLKRWARILAMVFAVLSLFNIPIGTIIGIVCLIYLTRPGIKEAFDVN